MLIIALVLALIGLVALVFAVVTSNELVAWVCIGASVLGVVLLIIDALRERRRRDAGDGDHDEGHDEDAAVDYPEEASDEAEPTADTDAGESSKEAAGDAGGDSAVDVIGDVCANGVPRRPKSCGFMSAMLTYLAPIVSAGKTICAARVAPGAV